MTDKERRQRIKELRVAAIELSGAERERFLAANATPEERREVEAALNTSAPTAFMATPVLVEWARASEFRVGDRFGKHEIQGALGAGGGGKVYLALDTSLRRQVAIKVLLREASADAPSRQRFSREAEAASALNHPNIVTVYEIGVENGIDYIAMEYIAGKSLRENIPKRGLSLERFFPWAIQIADALAAAHAAGLVHRDVKPGNVMITDRGAAKVVDFGLAKAVRKPEEQTGDTITKKGTVAGTYAYMAPEQAEAKDVDSRADIFSLGCVLYEMLTGRRAFEADSQMATIAVVLHREPAPVRDLAPACPPGLERIVLQCLRKKREDRWQNAGDVRLMLEQAQRDWEAGATEEAQKGRGPLWRWAAGLAAGALLAAGGFYWMLPARNRQPDVRLTALTMDGGLTTSPSISADGRLLAYASDRGGDGNLDIWVQQVGGRAPIRLTSDPADEKDPDISPDGTQVVFRSEKDEGGIYVIPALGGEPVLLAQGGRNPRFSPDGKSIAYWVGREGVRMPAGTAHVFIIPAGGGQPRALGGDFAAAMHPIWSPNGEKVLVVGRKAADFRVEPIPEWWVLPTGQGTPSKTGVLKIVQDQSVLRAPMWENSILPLAWRSQGKVIFTAQSADTVNLWAVDVDPGTGRSAGKATRVTMGTNSETQAAFAAAAGNESMVFSSSVLQFDIWAIPLDAERGEKRGEMARVTDDLASELYPSLSWDGSKLAFASKRGSTYFLTIRDLKSGKETSLLTSSGARMIPRLSGDARWLVYGESPGNISRIPARGGAVERLCERCGTPTSVSFEGDRILVEPMDSPEDVRELDANSRTMSTLVPAREPLYSGEMSRDGKWLVFNASKGPANSQLFIARVEGGRALGPSDWIPVTGAEASYRGPHWSPGGNVIYFLSDRDGFRCVWAQRLDAATKAPAGPIFAVQHLHHARRSLQHVTRFDDSTFAVGADMAVVVLGELTGNIWMREQKAK